MILTDLCLPLIWTLLSGFPTADYFELAELQRKTKVREVGLTRPSSPKNLNWIVALEVCGTYALNPRS